MILRPDPHAPWYVHEAAHAYKVAPKGRREAAYRAYVEANRLWLEDENEGYDWEANCKGSWRLAVDSIRERRHAG